MAWVEVLSEVLVVVSSRVVAALDFVDVNDVVCVVRFTVGEFS